MLSVLAKFAPIMFRVECIRTQLISLQARYSKITELINDPTLYDKSLLTEKLLTKSQIEDLKNELDVLMEDLSILIDKKSKDISNDSIFK